MVLCDRVAHECATLPHLFSVSPTGLKRNHSVQAISTKSSQSLWSDEAILQGNCLACRLCFNCSTVKIQGGLDTGLLLLWWQLWWCLNIWMAQRWQHNTLIQRARNAGFSMPLPINHLIIHPWSIAPISSGRWGTSLVQLLSWNSKLWELPWSALNICIPLYCVLGWHWTSDLWGLSISSWFAQLHKKFPCQITYLFFNWCPEGSRDSKGCGCNRDVRSGDTHTNLQCSGWTRQSKCDYVARTPGYELPRNPGTLVWRIYSHCCMWAWQET